MAPGSGTTLLGSAVPGAISGRHIVTQSPVQTTFVPSSGTKKYSVNPFASTRICWPNAGSFTAESRGLTGVGVGRGAAVAAPPHAANANVTIRTAIRFTAQTSLGEPVPADYPPFLCDGAGRPVAVSTGRGYGF